MEPAVPEPHAADTGEFEEAVDALGQPRLSRRERIVQLDEIAKIGERVGADGVRHLCAALPRLWDTLLVQCLHREKLVRVYGLRALRKLSPDAPLAGRLFEHRFIVPIMRAFDTDAASLTMDPRTPRRQTKETTMQSEKLQALKLVAHLVQVGASAIPRGVCMLLVSVSEDKKNPDTTFRRMCLETLRDLLVRNTRLVASCNGVQTLVREMLSTDNDSFAQSVAYNLLYVLNDPGTRCLIRPDDVRMLFAPFTDSDVKVDERTKNRLDSSSRVIVTMMRSWTGLFFLCSDQYGLRTLVETLLLPERTKIKHAIFRTLVNVLRIAAPNVSAKTMGAPEFSAFSPATPSRSESRSSVLSPSSSRASSTAADLAPRSTPKNLLDNYAAVLVLALVHAGLLEALQRLGEGFDVEMAALANELMNDLMDLSDQLFPRNMCLALHRLPRLVSNACDFRPGADALARERACIVVTHLQKYGAGQVGNLDVDDRPTHEREAAASQLRWIREQVESRMQTDKWTALLKESKVETVSYKECEDWEWEKLSDIVKGPLRNPDRLREVLSTSFVKAVLSVILPSKRRLVLMRRSPETEQYTNVECELLTLLISSDEGRKHKTFIRLLKEIKDLLECELKESGEYRDVLSQHHFTDRAVRDYFKIIGTVTSTNLGLQLLDEHGTSTIQLLQQLCTRGTRLDITQTVVSNLHYEAVYNHNILLVVLTEGESTVRRSATQHLLHLCRAGISGFHEWGVDALVSQLNDSEDSVVKMALDILLEACDVEEFLNAAVERNPYMALSSLSKRGPSHSSDAVGEQDDLGIATAAHNLLLRIAGHNQGVEFLQELPRDSQAGDNRGWIYAEVDDWDTNKNVEYVEKVEAELVNVLRNDMWDGPSAGAAGVSLKHVALPVHLYGQLGKTPNGCQLLREKVAKLEEWASMLSDGSDDASDRQVRAALWVIGHIGASEDGWALLRDTVDDMMGKVVALAMSSPVLSLRGTCMYVVGMLSSTADSRDRLAELRWARAEERSVAVPDSVTLSSDSPTLFSVPPLEYSGSWAEQCGAGTKTPADTNSIKHEVDRCVGRGDLSEKEGSAAFELLGYAADMQNTVKLQDSKTGLLKVKKEMPKLFTNPVALSLLYSLMDGAPLALRVRRFLQRLFEKTPVESLGRAVLAMSEEPVE